MAEQGIIKPPAIEQPNKAQERFIFTPAPGKTRMSAANREIYEKGMALAAAVRKGQLLPRHIELGARKRFSIDWEIKSGSTRALRRPTNTKT